MSTIAIDARDVTKVYRKFAHRKQFATIKSALLSGSLVRDLRPDETFTTRRRASAARLIRKVSSSRSSLMYVSLLPRLARYSGGCAM